jgi:hypothetical protein
MTSLKRTEILIPVALLMSISMWMYVDQILIPAQIKSATQHSEPRGNLSDLYPRWLGARELLLNRRDPYSAEMNREIQAGYYGRALNPNNPNDPKDQQGFAYPAYIVFLLAPTIHLPFPEVQRGYLALLWLLTSVSIVFWVRVLQWRPATSLLAICLILTLGSIPFVQGMKLQQLSLFVAFLLAGSFFTVSRQQLVLAGILLAFATIKPQLTWLPVIFLITWALRDLRGRQQFLWSFLGGLIVLFVGSQIILPGWFGKFLQALRQYHEYTHNISILGWIFTPYIGDVLAIILVFVTARICWPLLSYASDSFEFGSASALVMALTVVVVPMFAPYNQILLLPAVLLLVRNVQVLKKQKRWAWFLYVVTMFVLMWSWVASAGLLGIHLVSPDIAEGGWKLPFISTFTFPLMLFAAVACHIYLLAVDRQASKAFTPERNSIA